jgi:hypothetical protein
MATHLDLDKSRGAFVPVFLACLNTQLVNLRETDCRRTSPATDASALECREQRHCQRGLCRCQAVYFFD